MRHRRSNPPQPGRPASASRGASRDARRRARLLALCADLPGVTAAPVGDRHVALKVRRRTFAYYLNNHHGDGRVCVCCKSSIARQRELISRDPLRYYVPAYLGPSGWVSLRLDLPRIDWDEVFELVMTAYRLQAPRRLAEEME